MHADDDEWYCRCAVRALELVDEFGRAWLANVEYIEELRQRVRSEARRRKVRIRTYVVAPSVFVQALEPTVIARAYEAMGGFTRGIVVSVPGLGDDDPSPVARWDPPWRVDCVLPLV